MHLNFLHIDKYKNIQNRDFDFSKNTGYIALIGENGSGKSNLLEAISIIFSCLYNGQNAPFNYKIVYDLAGQSQIVESKDGKIISDKAQYPSSVIACYSGEDLRLWYKAYEGYHMQYFNKAISNKLYIPSLLYINKYCWKIAFISLLCASEQGDHSITDFLRTKLGINEASEVELFFTIDHEKLEKFKNHDALSWFNRFSETDYNVNARVLATTEPNPSNDEIRKQKICKTIFQYLYLLSQPKQNEINKVDKLITDIKIKIRDIDFDNLSEGEKKLILIECITKVLGDEESLILLDEPDAHIHIARKKELLNAIDSFEGQTVLTTHSPVFVNTMKFSNLLYLKDGEVVNMDRIKTITQLSDYKINVLEGAIIASSKKIIVTEGPDDVKHIKTAIEKLSQTDPKYLPLSEIPIVYQGGAKLGDEYYDSVLKPVYQELDNVIFVFDYDSEGREGAKIIERLRKDKLKYIYYYDSYPLPIPGQDHDFYLEDFYPKEVYPEIQLPEINNRPSFFQLKKCGSLSKSVKDKIQKKIDQNLIDDKYFWGYKNFLNQLLVEFNI